MSPACTRGRRDGHPVHQFAAELAGSYRLVALEETGADGTLHRADCTGSLALTRDGRMSVQVMYGGDALSEANAAPSLYARAGYEASFGHFEIDDAGHSFIYEVEGALVRTLVGKHLKRIYELSGNRLVIRPPAADERWRVTWERN
jgi:hypothetical protein